MRNHRIVLALLVGLLSPLLLLLMANSGCTQVDQPVLGDRPEEWAVAMGNRPGLSNFFRVSDQLYRGAQPEDEGFAELQSLGVKTVVNLRTMHSDRDQCQEAELEYVHITVQAWEGEDEEVADFLKVVLDPENQPVFLHCHHGADRTGVMCAVYRIVVQGWTKEAAIREMTEGGFGFHAIWKNLVDYVRDLDVAHIKELAGIEELTVAEY